MGAIKDFINSITGDKEKQPSVTNVNGDTSLFGGSGKTSGAGGDNTKKDTSAPKKEAVKPVENKTQPVKKVEQPVKSNGSLMENGNNNNVGGLKIDPKTQERIDEIKEQLSKIENYPSEEITWATRSRYRDLAQELAELEPNAENNARAKLASSAVNGANKALYIDPYKENTGSVRNRKDLISSLYEMAGKTVPVTDPGLAYLLGQFGDIRFATTRKRKLYDVVDENGNKIEGFYPSLKEDANRVVRRAKKAGKNYKIVENTKENGGIELRDRNGEVIDLFSDEEDAKRARQQLNKGTRLERLMALAQLIYFARDNLITKDKNDRAAFAGQGRPYKSKYDQFVESNIQGNADTYFKNEQEKNSLINRIAGMSDEEKAKMISRNNENLSMLTYLFGKDYTQKLVDINASQELKKLAAEAMASWAPETRNQFNAWLQMFGEGAQSESALALASGKYSMDDIANLWRAKSNIEVSKMQKELQMVEQAVESAVKDNKIKGAQADVIKELVAEQLQAAKLSNAQITQQMVTNSVDSVAKIIDAIVPGK